MSDTDLRKAGFIPTQPRRLILELLQQNAQRHLSADDIFRLLLEQGESVALATVYRVLGQFDSAGLVSRHQFDGNTALYELNQGTHHDHLICTSCGKIIEFMDEEIERRQQRAAHKLGFSIDAHLLYIFGRCANPECRTKR